MRLKEASISKSPFSATQRRLLPTYGTQRFVPPGKFLLYSSRAFEHTCLICHVPSLTFGRTRDFSHNNTKHVSRRVRGGGTCMGWCQKRARGPAHRHVPLGRVPVAPIRVLRYAIGRTPVVVPEVPLARVRGTCQCTPKSAPNLSRRKRPYNA